MTERDTQDEIRLAARELGLILWRNNVGKAFAKPRVIAYGLAPGSSDLIGIHVSTGRFVAIEVKSDVGMPTKEQAAFLDLVRRSGGIGILARSVDDVRRGLVDEAHT